MKILRRIIVPTGDILVVQGSRNKPIEMLSLGDYGKDINLNQDKPVKDGTPLMPLTEKWVLTISTQYGCSMGCNFCSPAGTLVNTPKGEVPIESLRAGDFVIGFDLEAGSPRINQIEGVGQRAFDGNLVELEAGDVRTLLVTPDHPIILVNGTSVRADQIHVGDDVLSF